MAEAERVRREEEAASLYADQLEGKLAEMNSLGAGMVKVFCSFESVSGAQPMPPWQDYLIISQASIAYRKQLPPQRRVGTIGSE